MGDTEDDVVKKKSKSLMERYDLIIENLTFEYIAQSKDHRELERILKVLRSGEEGVYPDLTKSCEERLGLLFPESRVLQTPQVVMGTLKKEEKEEMKVYSSGIRKTDHLLSKDAELDPGIPTFVPVRKVTTVKLPTKPTSETGSGDKKKSTSVKSVVPRSYAEWDKYDPEVELMKMDLEDERKMEKLEKKNKMSKNTRKKVGKYRKEEVTCERVQKDILTPCEQNAIANNERIKGNECYNEKLYEEAIVHYSTSIMLQPTVDQYNNRAAAYLQLEKFTLSIADCSEALNLDPWNVKALYRRGTAYKRLNRTDEAISDFQQIMSIEPNNFAAAKSLSKLEFEKSSQQATKADTSVICKPTSSHRMLIQELE